VSPDVSVYTYSSACPYAQNERQTIVFNNKTANDKFTKTYIYQHGDVSWDYPQYCGQAGFCGKAPNIASTYMMIGFRISESVDGKTWSNNYPFNCLYTEAKNVIQSLNKPVPNDTVLVSYSRGGAAMETALTKSSEMPSNVKVVYSIWLDSCFGNQCINVAKMPSSKRGAMFVYVSTGDTNNDNSNKTQEATKELPLTDNVYLAKVDGNHGDVGYNYQCGWDFVIHNNCKGKVTESYGKAGSVIGSGGMAPPGGDWVGNPSAYPAGGGGSVVRTINNISVWSALTVENFTDKELLDMATKPALKIEIPGVQFSEPMIGEEHGLKYFYFPFLSEYLAAVYQYAIAIASAISVVVIILNGFRLAFSGGSSDKISAAKTGIIQAIVGLLIAVGSYVLLYTINPELVNFRYLKVYLIQKVELDVANETVLGYDFVYDPGVNFGSLPAPVFTAQYTGPQSEIVTGANGWKYGYNGVPYFYQYDKNWGGRPFGNLPVCTCANTPDLKAVAGKQCGGVRDPKKPASDNSSTENPPCCTDIAHGGCNITSYAMVLSYLGKKVSPIDMAALAIEAGARKCNAGITSGLDPFHRLIEKKFPDLVVENIPTNNKAKVLELLKAKQPLISRGPQVGQTASGNAAKPYSGHYIVYTGVITNNGKEIITVNDPGRKSPDSGIVFINMDQLAQKARDSQYFYLIRKK